MAVFNNDVRRPKEPPLAVMDLPFEDNSFDLILLGHALIQSLDPAAALAEAGRVARKRVLVRTLNPCSLRGLAGRFQEGLEVDRWPSPWRLSGLARQVFGPCRMKRVTLMTFPGAWISWLKSVEKSPFVQRFPWGGCLFLRIDLRYTVRTRPLRAPAEPAPLGPTSGPARRDSSAWSSASPRPAPGSLQPRGRPAESRARV